MHLLTFTKRQCLVFFIFLNVALLANVSHSTSDEQTITALYHTLNKKPKSTMTERLDSISQFFLGKPYLLGALGEGVNGYFDQNPLYRTDAFDCETYVDTVLALAIANNFPTFTQCVNKIRYSNDKIDFLERNHFISADWNPTNQQQGFIEDITASFDKLSPSPITKTARAIIDKPSWYQHMSKSRINLIPPNSTLQEQRWLELKKRGSVLKKAEADILYIPLDVLFNEHDQPQLALFSQFPDVAIMEIVRPNWDLTQQIGTHLNVSHLGFIFRKNGTLLFREASSIHKKVIELPLIDYLRQARQSPTIKGINLQGIVPKTPFNKVCAKKNN